ncbi:hypothetical protein [Sphingomonas sp. LaA6.9]|uniref:hypothetical protein n=1 Tax=Sphingomonas sp. LaA6.9 TaxID=2919914 RepID=UPI001F4F9F21|nr:hypothetical protein [Sphingomonas sp. LaA6.9]MCJ8157021.1 hypothetical protein [Sphingomonas sp. LaA6.9]
MSWKTIRLELARTPEFPNGSPGRVYLLRLPLDAEGRIDPVEFRADPELATVRRYWPNEADQTGYVIRRPGGGWALSYAVGDDDDEAIFHLETHPIRLGEYVTITEADGEQFPFRVMRCEG